MQEKIELLLILALWVGISTFVLVAVLSVWKQTKDE